MSTLNPFQQASEIYLGITGGGPITFPPQLIVAGTFQVSTPTSSIPIAVPSTAKNIVVIGNSVSISGSSFGVFIADNVGSFGVDIVPSTTSNQRMMVSSYSWNSSTWVGTMNVGGINGITESKSEMLAGTLLTALQGVIILCVGGDFTAGSFAVLYQ